MVCGESMIRFEISCVERFWEKERDWERTKKGRRLRRAHDPQTRPAPPSPSLSLYKELEIRVVHA